jgi:hypothetical protein
MLSRAGEAAGGARDAGQDGGEDAPRFPPTGRSLPIALLRAREKVMGPIRLMLADAGVLPDLLDQTLEDEAIGSVTAVGAYDTRRCHDAIAARGAHAVISPRRNAKPWKTSTPGANARTEALRASRRLGRALWRRPTGDLRRSRAETKMTWVKRLGQKPMPGDFERQVRVAILNRYTALGIPVTEPTG